MILDQGATWKQIGIAPENAELLMSRRFTCEEIARLLGVPPIMVGIWDNASFTNSEQASRWYASPLARSVWPLIHGPSGPANCYSFEARSGKPLA
jgi:phage portal protein BeeE